MTRERLAEHSKGLILEYQLLLSYHHNNDEIFTQEVDCGNPAKVLRNLAAIGSQVLDRLQIEQLYYLVKLT